LTLGQSVKKIDKITRQPFKVFLFLWESLEKLMVPGLSARRIVRIHSHEAMSVFRHERMNSAVSYDREIMDLGECM